MNIQHIQSHFLFAFHRDFDRFSHFSFDSNFIFVCTILLVCFFAPIFYIANRTKPITFIERRERIFRLLMDKWSQTRNANGFLFYYCLKQSFQITKIKNTCHKIQTIVFIYLFFLIRLSLHSRDGARQTNRSIYCKISASEQ